MRVRSLVTVLATSSLLAAALLHCALKPLPPGPQAIQTPVRVVGGAIIAVPPGVTVDVPALVTSLKEASFTLVIIQASADSSGESVAERVALAVQLQAALGTRVYVGGYETASLSGQPMDALLQTDASFSSCYPNGPALDAQALLIDKISKCSEDIDTKVADELARVGASPQIGCYVPHQPELEDTLTDAGLEKLNAFFIGAASACTGKGRSVLIAPIVPLRTGDAGGAAGLLRSALQDSGVNQIMVEDGVGTYDPTNTRRASNYYTALRIALEDGPPPVQIWASVEAFDCETDAGCDRTHPTSSVRFNDQVCGARARVDQIVAFEYLHDLAGRTLFTGDLDAALSADGSSEASTQLRAIVDDTDAAAQLRNGYLAWVDAGASCTVAAAQEADAGAQADTGTSGH